MTIGDGYLIGVASGLTTALAIYLLRLVIGRLLSTFTGLFSPNLRGNWRTTFWKNGEQFNEVAKVYQLIHRVWGTITFDRSGDLRKYKFRGSIRENILVATYELTRSPTVLDRGGFVLHSLPGNRMEGKYAWTDDESQTPSADRYEWVRV